MNSYLSLNIGDCHVDFFYIARQLVICDLMQR